MIFLTSRYTGICLLALFASCFPNMLAAQDEIGPVIPGLERSEIGPLMKGLVLL